jgi:hypothetical protein
MKRITVVVLTSIISAILLASIYAKGTKSKIYQVQDMTLTVSGAAKIKVTVKGTVRTGGWTDPELVPSTRTKSNKSDDTTIHLDFVATKPTGAATQAIAPIQAEKSYPAPPAGKKLTVVVHAETNQEDGSIQSPNDRP